MVKDEHCILHKDETFEGDIDRLGIRVRQKVVTDISG